MTRPQRWMEPTPAGAARAGQLATEEPARLIQRYLILHGIAVGIKGSRHSAQFLADSTRSFEEYVFCEKAWAAPGIHELGFRLVTDSSSFVAHRGERPQAERSC